MDANFFYYSIYDRFIQIQPCACMHACVHLLTFSLKKARQNYFLWNLFFIFGLDPLTHICTLEKGESDSTLKF